MNSRELHAARRSQHDAEKADKVIVLEKKDDSRYLQNILALIEQQKERELQNQMM